MLFLALYAAVLLNNLSVAVTVHVQRCVAIRRACAGLVSLPVQELSSAFNELESNVAALEQRLNGTTAWPALI